MEKLRRVCMRLDELGLLYGSIALSDCPSILRDEIGDDRRFQTAICRAGGLKKVLLETGRFVVSDYDSGRLALDNLDKDFCFDYVAEFFQSPKQSDEWPQSASHGHSQRHGGLANWSPGNGGSPTEGDEFPVNGDLSKNSDLDYLKKALSDAGKATYDGVVAVQELINEALADPTKVKEVLINYSLKQVEVYKRLLGQLQKLFLNCQVPSDILVDADGRLDKVDVLFLKEVEFPTKFRAFSKDLLLKTVPLSSTGKWALPVDDMQQETKRLDRELDKTDDDNRFPAVTTETSTSSMDRPQYSVNGNRLGAQCFSEPTSDTYLSSALLSSSRTSSVRSIASVLNNNASTVEALDMGRQLVSNGGSGASDGSGAATSSGTNVAAAASSLSVPSAEQLLDKRMLQNVHTENKYQVLLEHLFKRLPDDRLMIVCILQYLVSSLEGFYSKSAWDMGRTVYHTLLDIRRGRKVPLQPLVVSSAVHYENVVRKTQLCAYQQKCTKSRVECPFAHGRKDLRPLPQHIPCSGYFRNCCTRQENCSFGHYRTDCA